MFPVVVFAKQRPRDVNKSKDEWSLNKTCCLCRLWFRDYKGCLTDLVLRFLNLVTFLDQAIS